MSEGYQFLLLWIAAGALTTWCVYGCTRHVRLEYRKTTAVLAGIIWPVTLFFMLVSGVPPRPPRI